MENAADALKIAFAVFVLVFAIISMFFLVGQAKSTSDTLLYYADETNFYNHAESSGVNRTVGVADVISTLYRYMTENIAVTVITGTNERKIFDLSIPINSIENDKSDEEIRKNELENYIEKQLLVLPKDTKFEEEFVETQMPGGAYEIGEDGTILTTVSGLNKLYVTYIKQ